MSCSNYSTNFTKKSGYTASGFAYISQNQTLESNINNFFISHNKLIVFGTKNIRNFGLIILISLITIHIIFH